MQLSAAALASLNPRLRLRTLELLRPGRLLAILAVMPLALAPCTSRGAVKPVVSECRDVAALRTRGWWRSAANSCHQRPLLVVARYVLFKLRHLRERVVARALCEVRGHGHGATMS